MSEFCGRIGHLYKIEEPWANAGGPVKTAEQIALMASTRVGWVEAGSFTPELRSGLSTPNPSNYFHDPKSGITFNMFKMPNCGEGQLLEDVPEMREAAHSYGKQLVFNVAPTGKKPNKETAAMVRNVYSRDADAVLVNPDCPSLYDDDGNKIERLSRNPERLGRLLEKIKEKSRTFKPIFLRIAPMDTFADMIKTCRVVRQSGVVSALFVSNTWEISEADIRFKPELKAWNGAGGKGGPGLAPRAEKQVSWAVSQLRGSGISVVQSTGIASGQGLRRSLDLMGADAGAGSTFYFESKDWVNDTDRLLTDFYATAEGK